MKLSAARRRGALFVAARGVHQILLAVAAIIIARELGPADRARYALPLAAVGVVWALTHLSLDSAGGRLLARREIDVRTLCRTLSAGVLVLALLGVPIALVGGLLARDALLAGADRTTVALAAATIPPLLAYQMLESVLLRLGAVQVCGWAGAATAALVLVGATIVATLGSLTPASVTALNLAAMLLAAIVLSVALVRREGWGVLRPALDRVICKRLVGVGLAVHPARVALQLGTRIDLLVVGAFVSAHDAGLYSLATALAATTIVISMTLPQLAMREQTLLDDERGASYTAAFTARTAGVAAVLCAATCLLSYPLVLLAYGSQWTPAVPVVVILTIGMFAIAIEAPLRSFVFRVGRPATVSMLAVAGLAANVAITVVAVELLGIIGAAAASVVALWAYALAIHKLFVRVTQVQLNLSPRALVLAWRSAM
jgi:O-antigen/teichoic acid export membrane protein